VLRHLSIAFRMALVTLLALGAAYPLVMTGVAQVAFRGPANGSLVVERNGAMVGSRLIGQAFTSDRYFHGRPSASNYDAMASGGTNLGPTSAKLAQDVSVRVEDAEAAGEIARPSVPVDMVTSSGSGLDPDISIANALAQAPRVARARGMSEDDVRRLVQEHTTPRQFGFLGEARVNVLEINLSLDGVKVR
jgi:K+-transporting ATPase ATPase C chain